MAASRGVPTSEGLRALEPGSTAQIEYALRMLAAGKHVETVEPALQVLAEAGDPRIRPALLEKYAWCMADPTKRDSGGTLRAALLEALRPSLRREDIPLLEEAIGAYQLVPPVLPPPHHSEIAGGLRAAGLVVLADLDPGLAGYHATRLLTDPLTSLMSGQPAVTAAQVLAGAHQQLPLYGYVCRADGVLPEVLAECLRGLVDLPDSLLPALIARYEGSEDEIVLVGLFDLLLEHRSRTPADAAILRFLRETRLYGVYRFLVHAVLASRHGALIEAVLAMEPKEREPRKREALDEAIALRRGAGR